MIYTETATPNEYIVQPASFADRLRLAWLLVRYPTKIQHRITLKDGEQWMQKNCTGYIMNDTRNLTKVQE
jgi:hypothetical protein